MSNLKKDIVEKIKGVRWNYHTNEITNADEQADEIINLIESVIGKDEDLPEDVLSVGFDEWQERRTRNQFRADIKSKLIGGNDV